MFMRRFSTIFIFLTILVTSALKADVKVTTYTLGMSPSVLHDQLVADKFAFTQFQNDKVTAIKKMFFQTPRGTEIPDIYPSTVFEGKLCDGKLYQFNIKTTNLGKQTALLLNRKQVYVYLKENNAVGGAIAYSKKEGDAQVVETYTIDRNAGSGSVRGLEEVKIGITEDKNINLGDDQLNKHPLLIQYQFKNKWFCPS